ncbi:MAG: LacI family DNA-binding transcriptional regulator [Oscillospiraceae bacterium]|nr:LacI family DNA-binding transcriptional regulator [Oscillospiraceae bacterium]
MNKITIRDVADKAGVSISTVHQALNGKKGVGEETRKRIQAVADKLGYQPNPMASSLKRKTRQIGILLPNSSYYDAVWMGARNYLGSVPNMNIECTELPFGDGEDPTKVYKRIYAALEEKKLEGILVTGHSELFSARDWEEFCARDIAVSLLGADMPGSHRIFCVMPDYEIIGRTMAELLLSRIPPYGSIALCAGNPKWEPHAKVVQGFEDYMRENGAANNIYRSNTWDEKDESYLEILHMISRPDVAACCSVLSQSSVLLGRALVETGKQNVVFGVGSDLSKENVAFLKQGVFNNLIQKNPYAQGYLGVKNLVEYLMLGRRPEPDKLYVGSEVVFRSNLSMYLNKSYRSLLR